MNACGPSRPYLHAYYLTIYLTGVCSELKCLDRCIHFQWLIWRHLNILTRSKVMVHANALCLVKSRNLKHCSSEESALDSKHFVGLGKVHFRYALLQLQGFWLWNGLFQTSSHRLARLWRNLIHPLPWLNDLGFIQVSSVLLIFSSSVWW